MLTTCGINPLCYEVHITKQNKLLNKYDTVYRKSSFSCACTIYLWKNVRKDSLLSVRGQGQDYRYVILQSYWMTYITVKFIISVVILTFNVNEVNIEVRFSWCYNKSQYSFFMACDVMFAFIWTFLLQMHPWTGSALLPPLWLVVVSSLILWIRMFAVLVKRFCVRIELKPESVHPRQASTYISC